MSETILDVKQLDVSYNGIMTLQDLTLELHSGEILGIVGESGSGKSTFLKAVNGILGENGQVEHGQILLDGEDLLRVPKERMRRIRATKLGMVFQHPGMSFNPIRKIGKQFFETLKNANGKIDKAEAKKQILEIFNRLNLRDGERILQSYPFELSGGMNQRVAIALAMVMNPQLLLADEPTSALDVTVQAQCVKELMDLRDQLGTTIIIVTHNMGVVSYMSDRIAVMYAGCVVEYGDKKSVMKNPQHPYTKALIAAIPSLKGGNMVGIPGNPPSFEKGYTGCPFAERCAQARRECSEESFRLEKKYHSDGHWSLCPFGCGN